MIPAEALDHPYLAMAVLYVIDNPVAAAIVLCALVYAFIKL